MKKSEFIARLEELFGSEDVEIYLETEFNSASKFNIWIDRDGDALIKPE